MERKPGIDLLRIVSAFAVVIIHTISSGILNSAVPIAGRTEAILHSVYQMMKWSVPVFFMISGYCVLGRPQCSYTYCLSRAARFLGVLCSFGFLYALLEEGYGEGNFTRSMVMRAVRNVIAGDGWEHMWFLYAMIGIYLVMPVMHCFLQSGRKNMRILTGLLFVFDILLPAVERWLHIGITIPIGGYLFYVCIGGYLAKYDVGRATVRMLCLAGLGSCIWVIFCPTHTDFSYLHPAICCMAVCVFVLVHRLDIPSGGVLDAVAGCTFGIYIMHPLLIHITTKLLRVNLLCCMPEILWLVYAFLFFFGAFSITFFLRKVPLLKRLL